jgi:hypothetical protein
MSARGVFLQSGLPNSTLAQVWNLSDQNQSGSLNKPQFILAMHLLAAVIQGYELPSLITENMVRASNGNFSEMEFQPIHSTLIQRNLSKKIKFLEVTNGPLVMGYLRVLQYGVYQILQKKCIFSRRSRHGHLFIHGAEKIYLYHSPFLSKV